MIADFFFKIVFFEKHYQSVKRFGSRSQDRDSVGSDLDPDCVHMISADGISSP